MLQKPYICQLWHGKIDDGSTGFSHLKVVHCVKQTCLPGWHSILYQCTIVPQLRLIKSNTQLYICSQMLSHCHDVVDSLDFELLKIRKKNHVKHCI